MRRRSVLVGVLYVSTVRRRPVCCCPSSAWTDRAEQNISCTLLRFARSLVVDVVVVVVGACYTLSVLLIGSVLFKPKKVVVVGARRICNNIR